MVRLIWIGSLVLLLSPSIARSQSPPAIVPGSRVRITEVEERRSRNHSGTIMTADADTIVLKLDNDEGIEAFPVPGISRLDVSRGRKGHLTAGAGVGALLGAGIGALLVPKSCDPCSGGGGDVYSDFDKLLWIGGGVVGMLVGAGIGATFKTDKWEEVPSSRWHVSACPIGPYSFALAVSMQWQ